MKKINVEFTSENIDEAILFQKMEKTKRTRELVGSTILDEVKKSKKQLLSLNLKNFDVESLDLLSGILLSSFRFDKYKTKLKDEDKIFLEKIMVVCDEPNKFEQAFKRLNAQIEGTLYARELTSEPPNIFYPEKYAEKLKELEELGIEIEILDSKALENEKMNLLLAAGQGSSKPPFIVIMKWMGNGQAQPIVLAGKGVCFDSGGLCLKQAQHQFLMKWDKAGAGIVAGVLKSLALSKAAVNVIGIVGLVENMPDGNALKPGDILLSASGQTIEIENTDAEGRLVLADCLWYANERFKPKVLIDLGTLTQETFASLGTDYAGLYGSDENLLNQLKTAGKVSGDLLWELPMGASFAKQIESSVADIKNLGIENMGENGAAAEFLKCFVGDTPWAHLDIGGVSWSNHDLPLSAKGVTGFGVRLLEEWIMENG